MGLENQPSDYIDQIPIGISEAQNLAEARDVLIRNGWKNVDFGFHLGRKTGALDLQKGPNRQLLYVSNLVDIKSYGLLIENRLPVLPIINQVEAQPGNIAVVKLPLGTRALDSLTYPDQEFSTGFLGSLEVMKNIANLLARIFKTTGNLPEGLKLNSLALVEGEEVSIRLIPPLDLRPSSDWEDLKGKLLDELNLQDPNHPHQTQVEAFEVCFREALEDDGGRS